jgi:glycolate oxidase subunit GlcD
LQAELPEGELRLDEATLQSHSGDKWFATARPDAVALPRTADSVVTLLRFANRYRIPVTPRGAGHGYVGGCVPVRGGIVLSLDQMNRILEVDPDDFVAMVEPGVRTLQLQQAVEQKGLFYPPDPASRSDCSIGGNIATNAGGPRCLKYGVTRDYVLGLQVVQADGTLLNLGGRTHKNKTGFELARLFVGSEGLLGVVTRATLKLLPLPPYRACLAVGFGSMRDAVAALHAIFRAGLLPCALEIADQFTLQAARRRTGIKLLTGAEAFLIIELDGQEASVRSELRVVERLLAPAGVLKKARGLGNAGCERIWQIRREFSYALRDTGLTKLNEDVVVPRGRLAELFRLAQVLQRRFGLQVACFGHAGDGNIHVNLMVDLTRPGMKKRSEQALDLLFRQVLNWDGAITGEHGIGLAKKRWWAAAVSPAVHVLHRKIRATLDPKGLLNPGKFV